jgi:hypothetical protein
LSAWIVSAFRAILQLNRQPVVRTIDTLDLRVLAFPDAGFLRCARVAQYIAHLIPLGPGAVGPGEVLTWDQRPDTVLLTAHEAAPLQFRTDALVDLRAGAVLGRNHQRILRGSSIVAGDGRNALLVALNLMDSALSLKILYCFAHLAPRRLFDYRF